MVLLHNHRINTLQRNIFYIVIFFFVLLLTNCSSFMTKEQKSALKGYDGEYILLQEASRGDSIIPKGERVRCKIIATDDFIKVYAMPSKHDLEKGEWMLILYLFPDDFEKEKFDTKMFEDRLYRVVKPVK